ncbi:hypothetical protein L4X63_05945 [Geomonas sp. Red32]|uniref:hypothetical protein n=1 Tax=Geomonas sp. Red32 TaxID=2912856 RepID=UPI00202CA8FF|nr:hypothetical protein [Geomonas sp. Red32]MCM0081127.1 hypothetical protein [Geomonas sp. Red32]
MSNRIKAAFIVCSIALITGCTSTYQSLIRDNTETQTLPAGQKLMSAAWKNQDLWILTRPLHDGDTLETYEFRRFIALSGHGEGKLILKEVR